VNWELLGKSGAECTGGKRRRAGGDRRSFIARGLLTRQPKRFHEADIVFVHRNVKRASGRLPLTGESNIQPMS
tara:strand:- start:33405 stop:33623 length:219 start_codon:yes stop_codon:yes gene_type:complete